MVAPLLPMLLFWRPVLSSSLALHGRGQGAERRGRLPARVEEVGEDGDGDGRGRGGRRSWGRGPAASRRPREAEPDAAGRLLRLGLALGSEGHCSGRERGRDRKREEEAKVFFFLDESSFFLFTQISLFPSFFFSLFSPRPNCNSPYQREREEQQHDDDDELRGWNECCRFRFLLGLEKSWRREQGVALAAASLSRSGKKVEKKVSTKLIPRTKSESSRI